MYMNQVWLFISRLHKYLGLFFAGLMVIWFVSGFVMIFIGFPKYGKSERLLENKNIIDEKILKSIDSVFQKKKFTKAEIYVAGGENILKIWENDTSFTLCSLDSEKIIERIDSLRATKIAVENMNRLKKYRYDKIYELDQWIPWARIETDLPIHKFYFDDENNTEIYISSSSGLIIQKHTSSERFWAYLGAIPHWLYFKDLRVRRSLWIQVVVWLSGISTFMVFIGIVLGFKRLRFKKGKTIFPYKKNLYRWHHITGFVFGAFVFIWTISGMFSLVHINLKKDENFASMLKKKWNENVFLNRNAEGVYEQIIKVFQNDSPKILMLKNTDDGLLVESLNEKGQSIYLNGQKQTEESLAKIYIAKAKILFKENMKNVLLIQEYDNYYYSKKRNSPLPIIKVSFNDIDDTVFYIDVMTGEILRVVDNSSRLSRWIYNAMHSFDMNFLLSHNELRIFILIILLTGGTIVSITGMLFIVKHKIK
ncbi:PepSY-associated TM helix domain protein [Chloroherpeton thalassium ATCC 35110]|uniref:PepSY-associated TM helix domain protein n=2 Tax=Chloroherpeton thalassium TaxID=100716 RepID=B3QXU1_CHLT3|nr:PepSY-associated TM helix domain protein [Chloroherpeton thalassium ATCC 35110]